MRTADHAAVNETVSLAPQRSRGFVNAILRNYLRQRDTIELPADPSLSLSVKYSFPKETCKKLLSVFGHEGTEKLLEVMNEPPKMTLRVNTLRVSREELLQKLEEGGIKAAQQHHEVVMSPHQKYYLDYWQADPFSEPLAMSGPTTLRTMYEYEPVPEVLTPQEAKYIIGVEGCVWTEYITSYLASPLNLFCFTFEL